MYAKYADTPPSDSEILALIGIPLRKQVQMFTSRLISESEIDERIAYCIERYQVYADHVKEFSPAVDALVLAKQHGLRTALVTSKNRTEATLFLRHFRGAASADVVICADDVAHPKPHPDSALLALERLGVAPERAAMLGDSIFDLQCARDAGVASVAVLYGAGREQDLLALHPDFALRSPQEVLDWVQAHLPEPCLERN